MRPPEWGQSPSEPPLGETKNPRNTTFAGGYQRAKGDCSPPPRRLLYKCLATSVLALGLLAAGCVTFPQLDSLSRTTSEPRRKKVREHAACLAASETQAALLDCMDARGYQFIKASNDQRAQECYSYRNAGSGFPAAYCFELKDKKSDGD